MADAFELFERWCNKSSRFKKFSKYVGALGVLVVVLNSAFDLLEKKEAIFRWTGLDQCSVLDPVSQARDAGFPKRKCLPGRITMIRWIYPYTEDGKYDKSAQNDPNTKPNRVLRVVRVDGDQVVWEEQTLKWTGAGTVERIPDEHAWISVAGGQIFSAKALHVVGPTANSGGFLLRKMDASNCNDGLHETSAGFPVLEYFVPVTVGEKSAEQGDKYLYARTLQYHCYQDLGASIKFGPDWPFGFRIVDVHTD